MWKGGGLPLCPLVSPLSIECGDFGGGGRGGLGAECMEMKERERERERERDRQTDRQRQSQRLWMGSHVGTREAGPGNNVWGEEGWREE